ncbi:MAG: UDP-2,3-diacylglucosamine diphosphatase LpxI [bacterium]|nr:MAG: UDP-2,3-diacylglucosamine diphosphatase LpxI [bacterium]
MIPGDGRIGVIAGSGRLPLVIARSLSDAGKNLYIAGLAGSADPGFAEAQWETGWYDPFSLQKLLDGLHNAGVQNVVLAGRIGHDEIFQSHKFDGLLKAFLAGLRDHRPATILGGLVQLLTERGFSVLPLTDVVPQLIPAAGLLAGPRLRPEQIPDLELGWRVARVIADQDVGQTAIVKGGAVVAVEGMEGTDETIRRAGTLSGGGMTIVKLAATGHDFRYDIPTIGPDTVTRLNDAGGGVIAVEAGRCFMLDFEITSASCEEKGITLFSGIEARDGGVRWPEV